MDAGYAPELTGGVATLRLVLSKDGHIDALSVEHLERGLDDLAGRSHGGLVLAGAGGRFALGADHVDLVEGGALTRLRRIVARIADWPVPVIAAVDGVCSGIAAELALAARLTVCTPSARFGFPDVLVGLTPAIGGSAALPRRVGTDAALQLLLGGRSISGEEAARVGLADRLARNGGAVAVAVDVLESEELSDRAPREEDPQKALAAIARFRDEAATSAIEAPLRIVELVEAARIVPQEIYANMEEVAFDDLYTSAQSRALRHIDGVERAAQQVQRMVKPKARNVARIAVAGTRGTAPDLAVGLLNAGYEVTLAEADPEVLEAGAGRVVGHYERAAAAGRITEDQTDAALDRLYAVADYASVAEADVVFDVVNARGAASKSLIARLDAEMRPGAVLATGSSQVGPDAVGAITGRAADVVAVRFFGESAERRAVEVAPGKGTDPMALGTVLTVLRRMNRLPVVTGPNARGVGQRLMAAVHLIADHLLEQGASVALIDGVARSWGLPLGSFAARDAQGIVAPSPRTGDLNAGMGLDRVLAGQGRRGRATGRGYYIYEGGTASHDPELTGLVDALRAKKGITPRTVGADEVRLSLIAAMANAGAAILAEKALPRPSQIDLLSVHGLGLARRSGGVMMSADLIGLDKLRGRIRALAEENPAIRAPHPMFRDLLAAGKRFADLN